MVKIPPPEKMATNKWGMEIPDQFYNDGGQVYWLFGGILFVAPMNIDGTIQWDEGGEVEFDMIDPELVTYAKAVEKALGDLEQPYVELREWVWRAENPVPGQRPPPRVQQ